MNELSPTVTEYPQSSSGILTDPHGYFRYTSSALTSFLLGIEDPYVYCSYTSQVLMIFVMSSEDPHKY